jgi:hypothetical protein
MKNALVKPKLNGEKLQSNLAGLKILLFPGIINTIIRGTNSAYK